MTADEHINDPEALAAFNDSLDRGPTPVQFPPLPLVSGESFESEDGGTYLADDVAITFRAANGATMTKSLTYRHGGWWA